MEGFEGGRVVILSSSQHGERHPVNSAAIRTVKSKLSEHVVECENKYFEILSFSIWCLNIGKELHYFGCSNFYRV